jgi:hypothetical protein
LFSIGDVSGVDAQTDSKKPVIATLEGLKIMPEIESTGESFESRMMSNLRRGLSPNDSCFNIWLHLEDRVFRTIEHAFFIQKGITTADAKYEGSKWREQYFEKNPVSIDYSLENLANYNTERRVKALRISKGTPEQQGDSAFIEKRRALAEEALKLAKKGMSFDKVAEHLLKNGLQEGEVTYSVPYEYISDIRIIGTPLEFLRKLRPYQFSSVIEQPESFEIYQVKEVSVVPGIHGIKKNPAAHREAYKDAFLNAQLWREIQKSGIEKRIQWQSPIYRVLYEREKLSQELDSVPLDPRRGRMLRPKLLALLGDLDQALQEEKEGQTVGKIQRYFLAADLWTCSTPEERKNIAKQRHDSLLEVLRLHDVPCIRLELAQYYADTENKQAGQELFNAVQAYAQKSKKDMVFSGKVKALLYTLKRQQLITRVQERAINQALGKLKK